MKFIEIRFRSPHSSLQHAFSQELANNSHNNKYSMNISLIEQKPFSDSAHIKTDISLIFPDFPNFSMPHQIKLYQTPNVSQYFPSSMIYLTIICNRKCRELQQSKNTRVVACHVKNQIKELLVD